MSPPHPTSTLFPYTTLFRSYARVTTFQITPAKMDEALAVTQSSIIPVMKQQHGFKGVLTLLRSEEHTSELQSLTNLVCRLLLEKKTKEQYDSAAQRAHARPL